MTDITVAAPLIGSSATAIAQQSACLPQAQTPTGRRTIRAYVAGSTALMNMLNPLEIVAFKLGVTGCSTAFARIEDLRHKRYAGIWKRPDDPADTGVALKGANEWNLVYLQDRHLRGAPLPKNMRLEKGCIVFTVPSRFTADDVNHAVHAQLQHLSLRPALALRASVCGYAPGHGGRAQAKPVARFGKFARRGPRQKTQTVQALRTGCQTG